MSKTAILNSGANYFIKCLSENKVIKLDQVIFANINGVDSNTDIDKNRMMPLTDQIVHTMNVTKAGLINSRTVVYSTILDTTIGDFSFNFIGLVNSETNTLCMALHTDTTRKIKTIGQQQGNTITESIWLEIDNASDSTGVTVNAETWQIDYSARLLAEDESIRKTNLDLYGRLGIIDGLAITKEGNNCTVNAGIVYVAGLRVNHKSAQTVQVTSGDSIYIDAALEGTTTGAWQVCYTILTGSNLKDYQDGIFTHFVEKIASIDEDGTLIAVKSNKVLTVLDKSSAINSDSESTIATSKAVKDVNDKTEKVISDLQNLTADDLDAYTKEYTNQQLSKKISFDFLYHYLPVGIPQPWPKAKAPDGWIVCDGRKIDKDTYPKLTQVYTNGYLPDLRGEFIRGLDSGRNIDSNRDVLSSQKASRVIQEVVTSIDNLVAPSLNDLNTLGWDKVENNSSTIRAVYTGKAGGNKDLTVGVYDASYAYQGGTRPRNIAFLYIVKAE